MPSAIAIAASAVIISTLLALSGVLTPATLSPQGCRMSWMSPSYVLQTRMDTSWTPLASRYSLWLYREVGWDSQEVCQLSGTPVLFIPGNAGSFRQVRSIASSAARQYYASPRRPDPDMLAKGVKPLDFFAVHFNEDLSAFHGPTLEAQRKYTSAVLAYIASLYPPNTQIIVLGHSMGGIVGVSMLPSHLVSAIITMSTPHAVPPARFDSRLEKIYTLVHNALAHEPTPILSICGGTTDVQIPSEFCNLPSFPGRAAPGLRKTVYAPALEGCWTGVGHNEMVWCHQDHGSVSDAKARVLTEWFRDGLDGAAQLSSTPLDLSRTDTPHETLPAGKPLAVRDPRESRIFLLPIARARTTYAPSGQTDFVLYLSQGAIHPVAPAHPLRLSVEVHVCREQESVPSTSEDRAVPSTRSCTPLQPTVLRVLPDPPRDKPFPLPGEGVDESEGVVAFKAPVKLLGPGEADAWVVVKVDNGNGRGWLVGAFEGSRTVANSEVGLLSPFYRTLTFPVDPSKRETRLWIPKLLSHALVVYRATPVLSGQCRDALLPPLLLHTSSPHEAHFFRLSPPASVYLHTHAAAPFVDSPPPFQDAAIPQDFWSSSPTRGLNLTIFSSGECGVEALRVTVDWWRTVGRWGPRCWNAILVWGTAVVCYLFVVSWTAWDAGAPMAQPVQALNSFLRALPGLVGLSFVVSFFPLPRDLWLGNGGEPVFAPIAPLILFTSAGLVCLVWYIVAGVLWVYGLVLGAFGKSAESLSRRGGLLSLLFISLLIFLVIPWQVEFTACYLIHFHNCAVDMIRVPPSLTNAPIAHPPPHASHSANSLEHRSDARNQKLFLLLLMTWVLPLVLPVVIVWVRTLATAGLFTPFDGDHFVLNVVAFMILTAVVSMEDGQLFLRRQRFEIIPVPFWYGVGGLYMFFAGPRSTYRMYDALNWPTIILLCCRLVPRLWRTRTGTVADSEK